jgi:hypothetical protein
VLRSACRALLILNLLYCAAALFEDRMPAWKMFESGEPLDPALTRRAEAYLPDGAYLLSQAELDSVLRWIRGH